MIDRQSATGECLTALKRAAQDVEHVSGWTHNFYRYPARFSPAFAGAAIARFSQPGDVIVDPYMGGGTTIVEGLLARRRPIGNDLNSLAAFVTRVKTTQLSRAECRAISAWALERVPRISYQDRPRGMDFIVDATRTRNLTLPRARFLKKFVAAALASIQELPTEVARRFARCALLNTGQWALDGRRSRTTVDEFRGRLTERTREMLEAIRAFSAQTHGDVPTLLNVNAAVLHEQSVFENSPPVSLVVTSPPYPGVHILYHRWQVDGRKETAAPYWIAGCNDGEGASFYNFGDRRDPSGDKYFSASLRTLQSIRKVMKSGAYMVQLVAFSRPDEHLPRYLANMRDAGFNEETDHGRIWRAVPNRKWHATLAGATHSAREVVLVHRAS